jgi:hypothetical protein
MLMSDMMVCGSTLLTMPVVMILSRLSGLPMVNTRSPSWTGVLPAPARYSGAGEAFGRAAMFTDSNATSFWGSAAISLATILWARSNCTAKYCELPTTC